MFLKQPPGKQEVAHLIGLCLQLMNVFPSFSQEEFAHSSAPPGKKKKKSQRWVFLKYSGLSSSLLLDSVVPSFYQPPLHTGRSGGGEISSP